jgi:GTPase SAR1 family protein
MIVGNHGTGKTTLVRQVGHEHSGIVYVSVPENLAFETAFQNALRWSPPVTSWWEVLLENITKFKKPRGEIYRLY